MSSRNMTAISSNGGIATCDHSSSVKTSLSDGTPKSDQCSTSFNYTSQGRTLRKTVSSTSLMRGDRGYPSQDDYGYVRRGSPRPMSHSREHLVARGGGWNTIGHEPGFRERIPTFVARQPVMVSELQTHFAVYKFVPRHGDELALNIGDAVHVKRIFEDLWCEGANLRTGERGIFPNRYVSDILSHAGPKYDFSEFGVQFFLRFLGSVEVFEYKGNTTLCQAIAKVLSERTNRKFSEIPPCSLEIDYRGIRLIDHSQENEKRHSKSLVGRLFNNEQKASNAKYFFQLKDVTFCGCYPNSPRYFGFVTKHPSDHRFACHTFMSEYSTEPVAKAVGQAFKRFSAEFIGRSSST